jgi:YidC/Oxa1 family membrane protein insertase
MSSLDWLFDAMGSLLAFFYGIVPNYGFIIVMLTLVVMVVVTPLTIKGTRSMMMMQSLQPEIRKLQAKHKDDRQKLNEELMGLYRENQVNPVGGCLPLLVQAPVFMVLYAVLRGLTRRVSDLGFASGWVSGGEGLAPAAPTRPPGQTLPFDPAYLPTDSSLYEALSGSTQMKSLGLDLAQSAQQVLNESVVLFIPYLLLIILVGVTGFVQQRQIQGRVSSGSINPQQQMIMKFLPIMLPIFSFTLPGGLVLYFAVSNLYRVGQQYFISRKIYGLQRGETIDQKRQRDGDGGGSKAVKAGAAVIDTTASENGSSVSRDAKGAGSATKVATKNKGADGTRARKDARPAAKRTGSGSSKGSKGGQRRSPSGGSPSPTVQPRGRKKKR